MATLSYQQCSTWVISKGHLSYQQWPPKLSAMTILSYQQWPPELSAMTTLSYQQWLSMHSREMKKIGHLCLFWLRGWCVRQKTQARDKRMKKAIRVHALNKKGSILSRDKGVELIEPATVRYVWIMTIPNKFLLHPLLSAELDLNPAICVSHLCYKSLHCTSCFAVFFFMSSTGVVIIMGIEF